MSVFKRPGSPYFYTEFWIGDHRFLRSTRETEERKARAEERRIKEEERAKLAESGAGTDKLNLDQGFQRYWEEHGQKLAWADEVDRYIHKILERVDPKMLVENVTDAEVNDFVQAWGAEGGGEYALNRSLSIWRSMHNRARKKWKQKTQVVDWTDFFNAESKRVRFITMDEVLALIAALPAHISLAVEWSVYTGCREAATFNLTWDDVHIDRGYASATEKGGKKHTVWLSEQALDVLDRASRRGRYVFSKTNKRRAFDAALAKAGIDDFCWHDLRHTHATWLRQAGVPVEVVQRSLGHADIATTMRYAHVDDRELQEALRKLPSIGTSTPKIVSIKSKKINKFG
jgi:integrase